MTHYSMTISDAPMGHVCQQRTCQRTTKAHITVALETEAPVDYDVCWEHAREIMTAPVDVLELTSPGHPGVHNDK